MKVTTTWSFRKRTLATYPESYFKSDWDYFMYLHLNNQVRYLHLAGTIIGLCLLPWATYRFVMHWEVLPGVIYTFFFYGVGFLSHYTCDGLISETWKHFLNSYKHAVRLNLLTVRGKYAQEELRFRELYPETLWVYDQKSLQANPLSMGRAPLTAETLSL